MFVRNGKGLTKSVDISIIVPAFNSSAHLNAALDSVAQQSVIKDESVGVEVILVDDGSTDATVEVFGKWCENNPSIPVKLHSQANRGPSAARNTGYSLTTAAAVVFLDADDWLLPEKLQRQWETLSQAPGLGGVHSGWKMADHCGRILRTVEPWHDAPKLSLRTWLLHKPVRLGAMMLRRSWLEKLTNRLQVDDASQSGPFDEGLWQSEDTDLVFRLALAGCRMEWLHEPTLVYRYNDLGLVHSDPQQQGRCNADVLDRFYARSDLSRHIRRDSSTIRYYTYTWIAWHLLQSKCAREAITWLKYAANVRGRDGQDCVEDWTRQFTSWSRDNETYLIDNDEVRRVIDAASHTVNRGSIWARLCLKRGLTLSGQIGNTGKTAKGPTPFQTKPSGLKDWGTFSGAGSSRLHKMKHLASPLPRAPLIKVHTPNSVLAENHDDETRQLYVGSRKRPATCSGAAWFHGDYLVTGNLLGRSLHVYRFDRKSAELHLVQSIEDASTIQGIEILAASADGRLLAMTDQNDRAVSLFRIDGETHQIASRPTVVLRYEEDRNLHGVCFSPCSRFLAVTTVDDPGLIRLFRFSWRGRSLHVDAMPVFETSWSPSRPKGIDFSPDGGTVVICFSLNAGNEPRSVNDSRLVMFRFDPVAGIRPRPIATASPRERITACDDVRFLPSGRHVILSEQTADRVSMIQWNPKRRRFGERVAVYHSTASGLTFPHGVSVSADGYYFAVTNYGDDSVAVFKSPFD